MGVVRLANWSLCLTRCDQAAALRRGGGLVSDTPAQVPTARTSVGTRSEDRASSRTVLLSNQRGAAVMSVQELLESWRKSLDLDSVTWRTEWQTNRREDRRAKKQRERSRRDRKIFGEEAWGVSRRHLDAKTREETLRQ